MPVFNGDGPVPMETPGESVDVSSDDSSKEGEGGEREKGPDSEATDGESRAPLPRRRSRALRLSLGAMTTRMMTSRAAGACPRSRRRTGPG